MHYVKATDCKTTIHPAIHTPTFVCSFKPARLYPLTVIEPALLPQFYLCGTSWYCVRAAQLLVILSFTDTVKPGKLLHQLDGEVSMRCWLLGSAGIPCEEHWCSSALLSSALSNTLRYWQLFTLGSVHFRLPTLGGRHQVMMRRAVLPLTSTRDSRW